MTNIPKYQKSDHDRLFKKLKIDVLSNLKYNQHEVNVINTLKAILLVLSYYGIYLTSLYMIDEPMICLTCYLCLGLLCLPLVLNIGHESIHNTFSSNRKVNRFSENIFLLLGTSAYFWRLRHLSSHHVYANVKDWDTDIEQTSLIRLSEYQKYENRHKYQHIYMPIVFCFYTFIWFFIRDFKDISQRKFGIKSIKKHPRLEIVKLIIAKIIHIIALIILPVYLSGDWLIPMIGFLIYHISASMATTFVLISTHVGEPQDIVTPDGDGVLPYSWLEHQYKTTADFSTKNPIVHHFFGGFNHHLAHHLFPQLSHLHYPSATRHLISLAEDQGWEYLHYSNLKETAISHLKRLKHLSFDEEI